MLFIEIIKTLGISFVGTIKAFAVSIVEFLPAISLLNDIADAFSYTAIISSLIGLPISLGLFVKFILKLKSS